MALAALATALSYTALLFHKYTTLTVRVGKGFDSAFTVLQGHLPCCLVALMKLRNTYIVIKQLTRNV